MRKPPRPLSLPVLALFGVLATAAGCPQGEAPDDCPPPQTKPDSMPAADEAPPAQPGPGPAEGTLPVAEAATTIPLVADDGHALNLWSLGPADPSQARGAVVLVHGRTWSSVPDFDLRVDGDPRLSLAHNLAAAGYVVYAVDLRGYGESERDATGWLDPERAADDLHAAMKLVAEREGKAPDLLGWSMGALVSHLDLLRHPEDARKLVLYGYPRDVDARYPPSDADAEPERAPTTQEAARSDFITKGSISEAAITAYVDASLAADPVRADWRHFEQLHALDPAALVHPTLVIHGAGDPIAKPLFQAKLFTRLTVPERAWVVLPDTDHAAHLERPEAFVAAVLGFLQPPP
ncbi:hydrolase [Plesiocystis pacifica SIR-1]|uniref:Hydrolase n=1 Tax=Plesiocystis pacifica SIR-1 TaxID=391625 RepID=A6GFA9_9BACT|nr:alpha/beta fold hydrolase [Plesiocystis pacifica]EDM75450.1 hydrolase [Plesiocystis pacifica SIR-1]